MDSFYILKQNCKVQNSLRYELIYIIYSQEKSTSNIFCLCHLWAMQLYVRWPWVNRDSLDVE